MHPALSVIFFTVVSGAGYGLLFLLGLGIAADPHALPLVEALGLLLAGTTAAAAGLTSSLLHLGQPQRAWRALSQWRSSWLSREGVSALAGFVPIGALAFGLVFERSDAWLRFAGALLALLAATTVYCTAQIYASLRTIRAWNNAHVTPEYFFCAALCGSAWLLAIHATFAPSSDTALPVGVAALTVALAGTLTFAKRAYWRFLDTAGLAATTESATGLGRFGSVRSSEAPHTEENYLTREMGFRVARKHARRLRTIATALLGPAPALLAVAFVLLALQGLWLAPVCAWIGAICATAGCFVERWLFFAEARHVVTLYYDAKRF